MTIAAVREVVEELESCSDYRPRGSNQIGTKIGPAKGGIGLSKPEDRNPKVDGAWDTHMTGTDAIQAAIKDLKVNYSGSSTDYPAPSSNNQKYRSKGEDGQNTKPQAPWRSKKEFESLINKGVCIRYEKGGYRSFNCPKYRSALCPNGYLSHLHEIVSEESEPDSGNESP